MKDFTAEYLEKVIEPSGWQAVWRTNVFEVLVEVNGIELLRHLSPINIIYSATGRSYISEVYELIKKSNVFISNCQ